MFRTEKTIFTTWTGFTSPGGGKDFRLWFELIAIPLLSSMNFFQNVIHFSNAKREKLFVYEFNTRCFTWY